MNLMARVLGLSRMDRAYTLFMEQSGPALHRGTGRRRMQKARGDGADLQVGCTQGLASGPENQPKARVGQAQSHAVSNVEPAEEMADDRCRMQGSTRWP